MRGRPHFNHLKYSTYRTEARRLAHEAMCGAPEVIADGIDVSKVRFEAITKEAIEATYLWGDDATLFPWEDVPAWKNKEPKGFDLALWFDQELCGLCYAAPNKSCLCIKVILMEGKPDDTHPLKGWVAPLSISALDSYARMLGCREIEIQDPAPGAVDWYKDLGFDFDGSHRLVISVDRD